MGIDLTPIFYLKLFLKFYSPYVQALLFHRFYSKNKVLTDDKKLSEARLLLIKSIQITLRNGLNILGISHPEKM